MITFVSAAKLFSILRLPPARPFGRYTRSTPEVNRASQGLGRLPLW